MKCVIENIKKIRQEKKITQDTLAKALGVDSSVISNIEKGKRELKVSELEKIASCLNVEVTYLITYPQKYVLEKEEEEEIKNEQDPKFSVTFEVSQEQKEALVNLLLKSK